MIEEKRPLLHHIERYGVKLADLEKSVSAYTAQVLELIRRSPELAERSEQPWIYKTLATLGEERFAKSEPFWLPDPTDRGRRRDPLSAAVDEYSRSVTSYLTFVEEGLPLYVNKDDRFQRASDSHEAYVFVRLLLRNDGAYDLSFRRPPQWAQTLWVNFEDFEAHKQVYRDIDYLEGDLLRRSRQLRRNVFEAFRCGLLSDSQPQEFTPSEPLGLRARSDIPAKLEAAVAAFNQVHASWTPESGTSFKSAVHRWLAENRDDLSQKAREEIATLVNINPLGGAPKTPGRVKAKPRV